MVPDEDLFRHVYVANLEQPMPSSLAGDLTNDGGRVAAAGADGSEA